MAWVWNGWEMFAGWADHTGYIIFLKDIKGDKGANAEHLHLLHFTAQEFLSQGPKHSPEMVADPEDAKCGVPGHGWCTLSVVCRGAAENLM